MTALTQVARSSAETPRHRAATSAFAPVTARWGRTISWNGQTSPVSSLPSPPTSRSSTSSVGSSPVSRGPSPPASRLSSRSVGWSSGPDVVMSSSLMFGCSVMGESSPTMVERKPSVEMPLQHPALRRLVGDIDAFTESSWGQRPYPHHDSKGFSDLLSVEVVDGLLESARRPGFRVVTEGRTLSPSEYTKTVRMGGTSLDDAASVNRIANLFEDGATLVMQGLERTHEPLRCFTRQLAGELSHTVQANAYLSPGGGVRGLGRHADEHDVFVL